MVRKVMEKIDQLSNLKIDIENSDITPELKSNSTQLVFGDGNLDADILFIGEAPGKNEDLIGISFIGRAGKFLNEMLESINLSRDKVYITNIVKYRPLNNRDPLDKEKEAFLPYLIRQINIIKPKIIITLGRHSMNCFLPEQKISEAHGKLFNIEYEFEKNIYNYQILPLFHPAAAIYNQALKGTLVEDFKKLPKILSKLTTN